LSASCPDVSVVIATKDRSSFLRQALTSALGQEGVNVEVLVVDDGSTDETPGVLEAFSGERLRVVRHEQPRGTSYSRNEASRMARAPWVAFLDDDDLWAPQRLRVGLDRMGDAVFGYCAQVLVNAQRDAIGACPAPRPKSLRAGLRRHSLMGGPSAVIVRADLLRDVGAFSVEYRVLNDWDLWRKIAARGEGSAVGDLLVGYTVHPTNMHLAGPSRLMADFDRFAAREDLDPRAGLELLNWIVEDNKHAGNWRNAAWALTERARRYRRPSDLLRAARLVAARPAYDPAREPRVVGPEWLAAYRAAPVGPRFGGGLTP
jgi:glycosyltransferase involved in cell wall biosynthesis